jgi:hypothetical protein
MKASALSVAAGVTGTVLDPQLSKLILVSMAVMVLLIYTGIALPAVWSKEPSRRKAAAEVLRQVLSALRRWQ